MSSISSISGGSSLYTYLQNLSSTTESQTTAPTSATTDTNTAAGTSASGVQGAHHHHGHGKGGQSQLFQQIQQAVTTALQSAQQNGSTNPNQTIEDAIASVFKNQTAANQTAGASQQPAANAQTPDADGDADGSTSGAAGATNTGGISTTQAFFQNLQSLGIDPQQFHQDFLAAVQDAQGGNNVDASSLFQNLPPGSIVDTTA